MRAWSCARSKRLPFVRFFGGRHLVEDAPPHLGDGLQRPLEDSPVEAVLVREVMVDERLRHVGRPRDGREPRPVEALRRELVLGRLEDAATGRLAAALALGRQERREVRHALASQLSYSMTSSSSKPFRT